MVRAEINQRTFCLHLLGMEKESIPTNFEAGDFEGEVAYTDNFTIRRILGQGGIGRVFLAFEKNIGREVAIKELRAERLSSAQEDIRDKIIKRFIREAKISGRLEHPGIVPVYEFGEKEDGTLFYVMKYVQGTTLFQLINECAAKSPEDRFRRRISLLDNLIAVCEAVGYAHSKGIIHRDLKPSNIILGEFGETIILDWGLAKQISEEEHEIFQASQPILSEDEADEVQTRQGALVGTPSYMAPEQINSKFGQVSPASDVFALGVILFMLLTGEKPYRGKPKEIVEAIASGKPMPSPKAYGNFIPPELSAICEKAMAKKKEERFQDAAGFAAELKAYRDGRLVSIYAYSKRELFKRFIARNKIVVTAAVAVILSIIIGSGFAMHFAYDARKAKLRADRALVQVTQISGAATVLSRNSAIKLDNYFHLLVSEMQKATKGLPSTNLAKTAKTRAVLEQLDKSHPEIEALFIATPDGRVVASSSATIGRNEADILGNPRKFHDLGGVSVSNLFKMDDGSHAFFLQVPIFYQSTLRGSLSAYMRMDKILPTAVGFDPLKSEYQVWCMRPDGYIIYDEDKKQVGRFLFTDEMYANFPELLALGEQMKKQPWGIGHYAFTARDGETIIYKIAAWDTFTPTQDINWKLVVTYPYISK